MLSANSNSSRGVKNFPPLVTNATIEFITSEVSKYGGCRPMLLPLPTIKAPLSACNSATSYLECVGKFLLAHRKL